MKPKRLVQVRIATDVVKAVDHLSVDWGLSRGPTIERLLREACAENAQTELDIAIGPTGLQLGQDQSIGESAQ